MINRRTLAASLAVLAVTAGCGQFASSAQKECGFGEEAVDGTASAAGSGPYLDKDLATAEQAAKELKIEPRVLIRDGRCLDHIGDQRTDRVNFDIEDGSVRDVAFF